MLKTVFDNVRAAAEELRHLLEELLLKYSALDRDYSGLVATSGNHTYRKLNEGGVLLQGKLLKEYRRFNAIVRCLLREQPKAIIVTLRNAETVLERIIEQERTWCATTSEALKEASEALQSLIDLLSRLYDPSHGESSYIPDTNALFYNLKLESWKFAESPKFTLILLPTVLSELDRLKINHPNPGLRKKAETLIRQIKEYRRRGRLSEGVPILKDRIQLVAVATEPGKDSFLPWLDSSNSDDRILANTFEVMRSRPRSAVILVTRDINLQNKAEIALIPFVEPPEP